MKERDNYRVEVTITHTLDVQAIDENEALCLAEQHSLSELLGTDNMTFSEADIKVNIEKQ